MSEPQGTTRGRSHTGSSTSIAGAALRPAAATALRVTLGIVAFFLILEFVTRLEFVPPIYLPRASTVLFRMIELLQDAKFLRHMLATLHAWAVGLAVAALISIPIGILIG